MHAFWIELEVSSHARDRSALTVDYLLQCFGDEAEGAVEGSTGRDQLPVRGGKVIGEQSFVRECGMALGTQNQQESALLRHPAT